MVSERRRGTALSVTIMLAILVPNVAGQAQQSITTVQKVDLSEIRGEVLAYCESIRDKEGLYADVSGQQP